MEKSWESEQDIQFNKGFYVGTESRLVAVSIYFSFCAGYKGYLSLGYLQGLLSLNYHAYTVDCLRNTFPAALLPSVLNDGSLFRGWYPFPIVWAVTDYCFYFRIYSLHDFWPSWSSQDQMLSQPWLLLSNSRDMYFLGYYRRKNWCVNLCMLCFPWWKCLRDF